MSDPILTFAERFQAFFDSTNDAIVVFSAEGEILDVNPRFLKISQYDYGTLMRKRILDLFSWDPENALWNHCEKVLKGNKRKNPIQSHLSTKSGRNKEIELSLVLLENQYGYEKSVLGIVRDISKRVEYERYIKSQADELQKVFNAVHTILFVVDHKKHIRRVNQSGLSFIGKPEDAILGKRIGEAIDCVKHNESPKGCGFGPWCHDCALREGILRCLKANESITNIEESLVCNDIHHLPSYFRINIIPFDVKGKTWGVVALEDITDIKKAEIETTRLSNSITRANIELKRTLEKFAQSQSQLLEAQKLEQVGLLASGFAHNLRSPLSGIRGYAELLQMDHPELDDLQIILDEVNVMEEIIENLLKKNRKDHHRKEEDIQLNDLILLELKFLNANMFFKHQVETHCYLDEKLPTFKGIYTHFSQVITNLLQNSLDAMYDTDEKVLTISTFYRSNNITIEIQDTGCGIPEDIQENVFQVFFTTKPDAETRKENEPIGTGLGLSSVKHFIRQYGGSVELDSTPGVGTKVSIHLPVTDKQKETEIHRVLIVDDEDSMVNILVRISQDMGFETYGTTDSYDAVKMYERIQPSVVITDLCMPGLSGAELIEKIRKNNTKQKVIYITGYSDNPDFRKWLNQELKHPALCTILKKPFRMEAFQQVLQRMIVPAGLKKDALV